MTNKNIHMTRLELNRQLISKETKKERAIISGPNFYLPIFSLLFSILNNLLIMDFLIGVFGKTLFHAFSHCSHFIPPEVIKVIFGFLMFSGSIKREHWGKQVKFFNSFQLSVLFLHPLKMSEKVSSSIVSRWYKIGILRRHG